MKFLKDVSILMNDGKVIYFGTKYDTLAKMQERDNKLDIANHFKKGDEFPVEKYIPEDILKQMKKKGFL